VVNIKTIIKEETLFESQEERLMSAYQKWCKKVKLNDKYQRNEIADIDGYIEELGRYSYDFENPYGKTYKKAEELYSKGDYEGVHKLVVEYECGEERIYREFKEWSSYRNQMPTSDIFQYKNKIEYNRALSVAKEKSFTKRLKKASAGEDFDKIWENDDMLVVVPKSHVGACKFGQGTRWCTASKNNNYFDSYYKSGILYRILQKNDNYKKLLSDFAYIRDIDNLSKVSVNLNRKNGSMSMVDKTDNAYRHERTEEFLHYLPKEAYKAIKNYQNLNEQKIKRIIREEMDDFDWVDASEPTMTNSFGDSIPINTKEAKDNFKKEVHGHYVISTPIENENEETMLAFGSVSYVKRIIDYINKHFPKEQRLYLATIRYSNKERANVLSYIRYY
tara:strand:- start:2036 stop:3205 length:1170 start_codon:yes stop_codon:yes gene_type:complete